MFIILLLIAVCFLSYKYIEHIYQYWTRNNVPSIPASFPFGNLENFVTRKATAAGVQIANFYKHFKTSGHNFGGVFTLQRPVFIPVDLALVKDILQTSFTQFDNKQFYVNERDQPISANLFFIGGAKWKHIRVKMTPTFTANKMKLMLSILLQCCEPMREHIESCLRNKTELDIKETGAKFTTDIIGSCAFGIDCNSFKNPEAEFRRNGRNIFQDNHWRVVRGMFMLNFQRLARFLGMVPFPKESDEFFTNAIKDTIKYRRENNITKNDFMQMLMKLYDDKEIDFGDVVAQAFVFFIAGFETSSTTMTFCMFELAQHPEIQEKMREEMRRVLAKHGGELSYEALNELTYTKQVIDETLRKYPPLPTIDRKCTKTYQIPGTKSVIPEGATVIISSLGIQHDPDNYPDPDKFDPERFSPENIHNVKPFSYLPFGEGPRVCIGQRFGIMQTKIGLVTMLKDYKYSLSKKTSPHMKMDFKFILTPIGDVLLDVEKVA